MESEVQVGQLVAGKYRIQQMLGRGGMGVVMAALHEHLNQRVALKFLTDDAYQQPEAVTRFLREARSAVQIQSEHVARVMDVGTLESGAPYMVMEYLRGLDLKEVSTRRGPMPFTEAVDFLLQACDAVAEAHSLGIVHRDLKPSNLFLTERPDGTPLVKVLDFGISKALFGTGGAGETSRQQMTASAAIMGSPQYMSPEQIRSSKNVDARADIWALGTILHELLAGAPAYTADTVPGLLAMIVADPAPPLSASRPDAPRELEEAILCCLEKDRERRFANVAEFARALERFASPEVRPLVKRIARVLGDSSTSRPNVGSLSGSYAARETAVQTHSTWARTGRVHDAGPVPFYARPTVQLGAGVGLVGVALVSWLLFQRAPVSAEPVTTATVLAGPGSKPATATAASPVPRDTLPRDTLARDTLPSTNPLGVRPLIERQEEPARSQPVPEPLIIHRDAPERFAPIDDDPRAARNFQDDNSAYPSASAKKRELAAAARRPRARPAAIKPSHTLPAVEREPDDAAEAPVSPPKKTNTLDLFNDTK
jgi:eukaryotic-like serine/threonine-protein kinase